ncbi:MAG: hypothetical protein GVY12_10815 [Bacteroidetes bacterium]|jgi:hypothetical protein|nr:hypothetical protein [Bacteroidota bacterium]
MQLLNSVAWWHHTARGAGVALALLVLAAATGPAPAAQSPAAAFDGLLVRVGGPIEVGPGGRESVVVVVQGNAAIGGSVDAVIVVDGTATLNDGARVTELVVIQGTADLRAGSAVSQDVHLVNAELRRDDDAVVGGDIQSGPGYPFVRGLLIFGLLMGLGAAVAVIVSGLVAAAIAPHGVRSVGATITDEPGPTVLAALLLWIGLPIAAALIAATLVGIPTAIGILLFLLPALGFLGYVVAGIRLGDYILGALRGSYEAWHPYQAALVGLVALLAAGWIPVLGAAVSPAASLLGSGALTLRGWRAARWPRSAAKAPRPYEYGGPEYGGPANRSTRP